MPKGLSTLVSAVMVILITVTASILVASWLTTTTSQRTETIKNQTKEKLNCVYADMYIESATFDCNSDCSPGISHNLTVSVRNSGTIQLSIDKMYIQNTTGDTFEFTLSSMSLSTGESGTLENISTSDCTGYNSSTKIEKIIVNSANCPSDAYDTIDGDDVTFNNC
jgi:archaellum component FlaG (FlaF/FlaG flagellin family)